MKLFKRHNLRITEEIKMEYQKALREVSDKDAKPFKNTYKLTVQHIPSGIPFPGMRDPALPRRTQYGYYQYGHASQKNPVESQDYLLGKNISEQDAIAMLGSISKLKNSSNHLECSLYNEFSKELPVPICILTTDRGTIKRYYDQMIKLSNDKPLLTSVRL